MQIACRSRGAQSRSRATHANTICSFCGLGGALYIPDATAPECKVCIEAPFRADRRRAVAETHQKRMSDFIHKCGKAADVQLELPHDARLAITACLWSWWPSYGADTGDLHIFDTGLLPEFVPSPHRATWWAVTGSH